MLKVILFMLLAINIAFAGVCTGFSQDSGKTCLGPHYSKCITYAAPKYLAGDTVFECTACDPFYEVNEDKDGCVRKAAYYHFTALSGSEYVTWADQYYYIALGLLEDYDYSLMSCAIDGYIVLTCEDGYVYTAEDYKCTACTATDCVVCDPTDLAKCLECPPSYVLTSTNTCTKCSDYALSCASETEAETCAPGSFINASKKCELCGANMTTCTSATVATQCDDSFYKTTAGACTPCATDVARCTSDTAILECDYGNGANYIYYYEAGCVSHLKSNNCLTLSGTVGAYECATCISGYTLSNGVCVECTTFVSTADSDDCSNANVTPGDDSTAAVIASCASGWYLASETGGDGLCNPCPTGCATCEPGSATVKCLTLATGNTHYIDIDATNTVKACADAGTVSTTPAADAEVATCTVDSAGARTVLTCVNSKEYLFTDSGATFGTADTPAWSCVANDSSNANHCATYNKNSVPAYKCISCIDDYAYKITTSDTAFATATAWACVAVSTSSSEAWYACASMKYHATGTLYTCDSCITGAYHDTTTTTAKRCKLNANCTTMTSATVCGTCADTYTVTTTGTCVSKSITNCATYAVAAAAKCSACDAGYYFSSTAQTACTQSALPNCLVLSPTMTGTKSCFACNQGYKWNTTSLTCEACDDGENICETSGCADLEYPGKDNGDDDSGAAAANSALMVFILTTLVALMSLLI